ncbi:MAG: hypothetical protein Q8873_08745, partial [Bacillota bacterium]|nr:hypothetical protein [Bacillota bacterium]
MKRLSIFLIFNLIFSTLVFVHAESINTSEISEPVSEETATNPDFVAPSSEQTVQSEQDITATEPVSEEISPIQQSGGNTEEIAPAVDTGGLSVNSGTDGSSDVTSDAGAELSNENQVTEQPSNEQEIPILPKSDDMANENLTVSAQSIFEGNIPVFTNPLSFTEDFSVPKNPLVPTVGDSAPYSQFASVKYWGGNDASSLSANNGIIMPDSQESYSVSTLQPVTGNHIFNFNITHPTYNNLNSGIYIGMRTSSQFVNFDGASYTDLPSDGIWLGISYNFVGIGTDLVDGTNSKRFTMNDDFVNYSHFMVCDDVDSGIISYYYINDATNEATLFARIDITEDVETSTTSLTYSVNTSSGLSAYTVTVNGLISNGKSDTYPQLFVNKYKCDLHSFGITCEGNENAVLNGISVNGAEVSPEISLDNTAYTVKTPR